MPPHLRQGRVLLAAANELAEEDEEGSQGSCQGCKGLPVGLQGLWVRGVCGQLLTTVNGGSRSVLCGGLGVLHQALGTCLHVA